jgi:GGDEF domain-containing protein
MDQTTFTLKDIIKQQNESNFDYKYFNDELTDLKNKKAFQYDLENKPFYSIHLIDIDNFRSYKNLEIRNYILKESVKYFQTLYFDQDIEFYRIYGDGFILKPKKSITNLTKLSPLTIKSIDSDETITINYTMITINEKQECLNKGGFAFLTNNLNHNSSIKS